MLCGEEFSGRSGRRRSPDAVIAFDVSGQGIREPLVVLADTMPSLICLGNGFNHTCAARGSVDATWLRAPDASCVLALCTTLRVPVLVEVVLVESHVSYGHCRVPLDTVVGGICISKSHADIWSFVHRPWRGLDLS